ncbi:MAG: hypothetical protein Q9N62_13415 [Ghiorsea sp.]|nr:hypothetical protein [Ghiorsea sp.]
MKYNMANICLFSAVISQESLSVFCRGALHAIMERATAGMSPTRSWFSISLKASSHRLNFVWDESHHKAVVFLASLDTQPQPHSGHQQHAVAWQQLCPAACLVFVADAEAAGQLITRRTRASAGACVQSQPVTTSLRAWCFFEYTRPSIIARDARFSRRNV